MKNIFFLILILTTISYSQSGKRFFYIGLGGDDDPTPILRVDNEWYSYFNYKAYPNSGLYNSAGDFTTFISFYTADTVRRKYIFGCRTDADAPNSKWYMSMEVGGKLFARYIGAGGVGGDITTTTNFADSSWHHLALVCNKALNTLSVYVDGSLLAFRDITGSVMSTSDNLYAGAFNTTGGLTDSTFEGYLDNFEYYNSALTQAQIQKIVTKYQGEETNYTLLSALSDTKNLLLYADYATNTRDANNKVTSWTSILGAEDVIQPDTSLAPTYVAGSGLYFTTNDYMTCNGIASNFSGSDKPFSIIMTVKQDNISTQNGYWSIAHTGNQMYHHLFGNNDVNHRYQSNRRDDAAAVLKTTDVGTVSTNLVKTSYVFAGTIVNFFVDGAQLSSDADMDVGTMSASKFMIGCYSKSTLQAGYYLNGYVKQLIVFSRAISETERIRLESLIP